MKKITDKTFNFIYKSLLIFTIGIFSIALIGGIFFYENRSFDKLNPIPLIIGTIIYLLLIIKLYKFINKIDDKKKKHIAILLIFIHFILLLASTFIISSIPQVDLIHILKGINSLNESSVLANNEYFSVYPNNQFLLLILYNIQRISPNNSQLIFNVFSSLCITISCIFTYKTIKKVFDNNKALLSLFIWVTSPIFYLYVSYYYTDILMLPVASILIYLIVKAKDETSRRISFFYSLLIGFIAIIGYKIRAVAIFLLIAYFVYLLLNKKLKNIIVQFIPITVSAILTIFCINTLDNQIFHNNIDKTKEFPITHWIMMGINSETDGYYNQDDYDLTDSASDKNIKVASNIETIKNRLSSTSPLNMAKLFCSKIYTIWAKGDYSYQKYLELVNDYNISYQYLLEDKNIILNYILQIIKISILVLTIIALMNLFKNNQLSMIAIAIFGAALFYLIWEVCPRYGLSFLPWLLIIINYAFEPITNKFQGNNKIFRIILLSISIVVLLFGFYKFTRKTYKDTIVASSHSKKVEFFDLVKDQTLEQSVNLYMEFNEIDLKFRIDGPNNRFDIYKLELLDEEKNVLFTEEFYPYELNDDKYTIFSLDKSYPKGNYYIKLSTESLSILKVYLSSEENYDLYKLGKLYVNNNEVQGDLMFEVVNEEYRGTYTTINYCLFMVVTIVVEYVILFKKKEEVNEK